MNRMTSCVISVFVVFSSGIGLGAVQYRLKDLGTLPGGSGSNAYGINNLGQVVGCATDSLGNSRAFLYGGGSMQDLGAGTATDINDVGQILIGSSIYRNGSMQNIGDGSPLAINNLGQAVGFSYAYASTVRAFLYSDGSMQNLGTLPAPNDYSSAANDINDNGQVVGKSHAAGWAANYSERAGHAILYSSGSKQDLGALPAPYNFLSNATGINNLGQVVGYSSSFDGAREVFLYSDGSMRDLGMRTNSWDVKINNLGQVVTDYFLYDGGVVRNLNSLLAPGSGYWFEAATGINDLGQISGYGTTPGGQTHAFLLTPEPPAISWKGGSNGAATAWGVASNWSPGTVPDAPGVNVEFGTQPANYPLVDILTVGRTVGDITFAATTSTTIRSPSGLPLILDNDGSPSVIDVAGSHTIGAPVIINNDATIRGSGALTLSGGISGNHALTVLGHLTASRIEVDTLTIGGTGAAGVPEPSGLALVGIGAIGLSAFAWRKRKASRRLSGRISDE